MKSLAGPIVGLALGLVAGFAFGHRLGFNTGMGFLETEVNGSLSIHVEAASCIRVGDTERALELLDTMIDAAVVSVAAQPGPLRNRTALSRAKLYHSLVPPSGPAAVEVRAALERVHEMELPPEGSNSTTRSGLARLAQQAE